MWGFVVVKKSDIMLSNLLWGQFFSNYWPSGIGCLLFSFLFSFLLIREIFLERKHFKESFCDLTGAKREKHCGQREFQMNLCKEQLDLERLLSGERAGFSCLPSCLPFKRTIFLCLKAAAVENAEISRSIYWKCWDPQTSLPMSLLWDVSVRLSSLWSLHWRCNTWNEKKRYLAQTRTKLF